MEKKILVVDIETTGFSTSKDVIVEIGIVSLNLLTGEIETLYDKVVRDERFEIDYHVNRENHGWIFQNSDLTVQQVLDAESLESQLPIIQEIFNKYPNGATAYNREFDFRFLNHVGLTAKRLDCPMKISTNICKLPHANGRYGNKFPTVEEAYNFFIPINEYVEKHRGADDAKHEAEIVYALHKLGFYQI